LFQQGAISINGEKVSTFDSKIEVSTDDVIKVGKRSWFKVKVINN
ncbi:uncharacterized protein METZ01_LOCUS302917, partial [marine metagenome]